MPRSSERGQYSNNCNQIEQRFLPQHPTARKKTASLKDALEQYLKKLWSVACLDATDQYNFMPIKRGTWQTMSPNSVSRASHNLQSTSSILVSSFISWRQLQKNKKLADRACKARYLISTSETQYLVLHPINGTTRLARSCKFLLEEKLSGLRIEKN